MNHGRLGLRDRALGMTSTTSSPGGRSKGSYTIPSLLITEASLKVGAGFRSTESPLLSGTITDCGYWAICLWRSTERVRNVSPSRLTSVLATVLCLVLGVGFCCWLVFSCFGASCLVVFLSSLVHHTLRHT